ncbi:bifunctional serine/threonine-protein kinase/formylglycine-generating enzyme family protein [Massilia sp. CFBP9026]|uniref:bifunctional serine/threonine-protein kinase/formylglycine-generating enzyme family protein n=1 Tax=Massilia sp. CFBP9026 TaxID=3096536 RepID=UPI002A69F488|nr:SUMF1/EgtB/PvdO family nonheme iron enzyme [Massilia sp. CFBP9026]MDY0964055.1 SUMF1/EgtB/PvdO family nonheme iron enzyme [Massilia sp. CFBP9026]
MQTAIDKIRELRALHEDGLLSRQEFDLRKNAILDAAYTPAERAGAGAEPQALGTEIGPVADVPMPRPGTEIGLMAGQEIGPQTRRYRLERLIAHGGMGQVWQATDLATHAELGHSAQVALKILPPHLTQATSHAKLLIQEATRARRLAHERIVRVYEWAQDPATSSYFIIMEYLEGEDLDAVLARESRLPLDRVLALLDPVADALDYAWGKHRLVHRDIKPGNVFVTRKGEVKLLDFGIAARARASGAMSPFDAPATSGTAGYRSPEAALEGRVPEPTLDVYAVAVMIHQLLTGVLPGAPGGQVPETLGARQWDVLRAGFASDPAQRPATVHALLDAIRAAAGPSAEELAVQEAARRVEAEKEARELAARRKVEAEAAAAAQARLDEQRRVQLREQQRRERVAAEEARLARKESLRQQLLAKRDEEVAKAQAAKEETARKAAQARAAAAYIAQQKKAREEELARAAEPAPSAPPPAMPAVDPGAILHDPFTDGSGNGPALVLIQAGRFEMGSPDHERRIAMAAGSQKNWIARETPQHWVGIERPFAMGRYPVTVGEWRAFVQASGWEQHGEVNWESPGFPQTEMHPVVGVTWFDALQYVAWLGAATGRRYRLPSEAEWEYACRAGSKTAFNVGDTISTLQANFDGSFTYNGGPRGEFRHGTTPADMFAPNAWGLHDMHGNVWEWVQDVVHDNYEGAPIDGSAWELGGDQVRRILRGGSWLYNPRYLRAALRNGFSAVLSNDIVGFRVVREL